MRRSKKRKVVIAGPSTWKNNNRCIIKGTPTIYRAKGLEPTTAEIGIALITTNIIVRKLRQKSPKIRNRFFFVNFQLRFHASIGPKSSSIIAGIAHVVANAIIMPGITSRKKPKNTIKPIAKLSRMRGISFFILFLTP